MNNKPDSKPVNKFSTNSSQSFHEEYHYFQTLFDAQSPIIQRFLESQARNLANAFVERLTSVHFMLPDRIICKPGLDPTVIQTASRNHVAGIFMDRIQGVDVHITLRKKIAELEQSSDCSISVSGSLLRHTTAIHMIRDMLPAGRSVEYVPAEGEDIPTIPKDNGNEPDSAITAESDAITEGGGIEDGRGSLQVPYVPAARKFYLPQWVAFDEQDNLLVSNLTKAEANIASMQRFLKIVHAAHSLAPYMLADDEYRSKRYGMLGQLINQGRALARYQTKEIIRTIKQRASSQSLNRGLSIRLPYFDDQDLEMKKHNFVVIPAGRIMFVPAFVVRASREEKAKIAQDTRFNLSTRNHILSELNQLENAFHLDDEKN